MNTTLSVLDNNVSAANFVPKNRVDEGRETNSALDGADIIQSGSACCPKSFASQNFELSGLTDIHYTHTTLQGSP